MVSLGAVRGSESLKIKLFDKDLLGGAAVRSARPCSCSMTILTKPGRAKAVNSSTRIVARKSVEAVVRGENRRRGNETAAAAAECEIKLDEWMRDSVTVIVKNLREAPLLVHVYGENEARRMRLETEKRAEEKNWDALKGRWEAGVSPSPEGVIFVEELTDDDDEEVDGGDEDNADSGDGMTKAWGLVVQRRGEECGGPACYLLKTSTVNVGLGYGLGMGMGCTHFCLVRVKNFRETAESQLKNSYRHSYGLVKEDN